MPFNQTQIIEQATFTYSPLGKAFEKQRKTTKGQRIKQIESLKSLKPNGDLKALKALKPEENQELESTEGLFQRNMRTDQIKNEIDEIRKWEEKII